MKNNNKNPIFNKNNFIKILICFLLGFICRFSLSENLLFELIGDINIIYILTYLNIIDLPFLNLSNNTNNILRENLKNSDVKFKDSVKCKIYWYLLEKDKDKYLNYKSYKYSFNYNINLSSEIKDKLHTKFQDEIYKLKLNKKTLLWFINRNRS